MINKKSIIGRSKEIQILNEYCQQAHAQLICIYGRRRIGKSFLIEQVFKNKNFLHFEGLENEHTDVQIKNFTQDFAKQTNNKILSHVTTNNWFVIFDELTKYLQTQKKHTVVFFDEFQWMAAQKTLLVAIFKKYWDQHWSNYKVTFILCGSIASYMMNKVIRSKALYGRINLELNIGPLDLSDCHEFIPKRSQIEVLKYYLTFGGVPKYWTLLMQNKSYQQNIENLFLEKNGYLFQDYEKIFYSQFKEHTTYVAIIRSLSAGPLNLDQIGKKINKKSSGSLKSYLDNLISAGFITDYSPYDKIEKSKLKKYKISDEYLRYYFKFIDPNKKQISSQIGRKNLFHNLIESRWDVWAGFAFENFCIKNSIKLAETMGFSEYIESFGPYFNRNSEKGTQIDLLYKRSDKVITVCEIKYYNKPISADVIADVEEKIKHLKIPVGHTIEKALITVNGAEPSLRKSKYFQHIIELKDLF